MLLAQRQLVPHWSVSPNAPAFTTWLADRLGVDSTDVLGWDLMTYDLTGAARIGLDGGLIASARLDNLATSYAAVRALLDAVGNPQGPLDAIPVIALFDHEEIGSMSERGAFSQLLPAVLERIVLARGGDRQDHLRALASTVIASGDMAHATHPNYADRHEPGHHIAVNGGPVLKVNTNGRYATDGLGTAAFRLACQQAGVPMQEFVTRSDLPCGSTVGPMTAALTGATTVELSTTRVDTNSDHGTGCTLSAAIAALVPHNDVVASVRLAKDYLTGALQRADELDVGSGHGPVHHFHALWSAPAMRGERS